MQTIFDLNKAGIPIVVSVLIFALAFLWNHYEKQRTEHSKIEREHWATAIKGFQDSQDRMTTQFTAALKEIAQEMRENRRSR